MSKIHLVALSSDILEDDFEEGIKDSTGCGLVNQPIGQTFDTIKKAIEHLAKFFGLSAEEGDYELDGEELRTSKMVANHCDAQNGGWFEPTPAELAAWRRGEQKLYSEDFVVRFVRCI